MNGERREITKRERVYMMAIRRQLLRIRHAQGNAATISIEHQVISSLLAILSETERFTGAQVGSAYFLKPIIVAAARGANCAEYDFIGSFVTAIEDRYRIDPLDARESDVLLPS